eukprot:scaffold72082_cov36-Phaeocystis_antarctica.AAC.2
MWSPVWSVQCGVKSPKTPSLLGITERRDVFLIGEVGAKRDLLLLRLRLGLARRRGQHDPADVDGTLEVVAGSGQQPVLLPAGGVGLSLLSPRRLGDDDRMHLQRACSADAV